METERFDRTKVIAVSTICKYRKKRSSATRHRLELDQAHESASFYPIACDRSRASILDWWHDGIQPLAKFSQKAIFLFSESDASTALSAKRKACSVVLLKIGRLCRNYAC